MDLILVAYAGVSMIVFDFCVFLTFYGINENSQGKCQLCDDFFWNSLEVSQSCGQHLVSALTFYSVYDM